MNFIVLRIVGDPLTLTNFISSQCDETRPGCKRCRAFGVTCNFGYNVPDLQPHHQSQITQELSSVLRLRESPLQALGDNLIWSMNESSVLHLDALDHELFCRFRYRTVYSLGGPAVASAYENRIFEDSFSVSLNCGLRDSAMQHPILGLAEWLSANKEVCGASAQR